MSFEEIKMQIEEKWKEEIRVKIKEVNLTEFEQIILTEFEQIDQHDQHPDWALLVMTSWKLKLWLKPKPARR